MHHLLPTVPGQCHLSMTSLSVSHGYFMKEMYVVDLFQTLHINLMAQRPESHENVSSVLSRRCHLALVRKEFGT